MSFMKPEIHHGQWVTVETECGYESLPFDLVTDGMDEIRHIEQLLESNDDEIPADLFEGGCTLEGDTIFGISVETKWGARLSAPGYLDCTDWTLHDTKKEAEEYLEET